MGLPSSKLQVGEEKGLDLRSHCVDLQRTLREVVRKTLTPVCEFAKVPRWVLLRWRVCEGTSLPRAYHDDQGRSSSLPLQGQQQEAPVRTLVQYVWFLCR